MRRIARRLALAILSSCFALSAHAQVVISQPYGGGGNSGATYTHDFVELFNRGSTPVPLSGKSVQYASATGTGHFGGTANQILVLPDATLQPGQYYLVGLAGGSTGAPLPTPDASGTINMSGSSGKVALVDSATGLGCNGGSTPCSPEQEALILDLVGYGSANYFEGGGAAPGLTSSTSAQRTDAGCSDSNDNAVDFASAAPAPRNSGAPFHPCNGSGMPVVSISDAAAAEGAAGAATEFLFTLSLSAPAGADGVGVSYATSDGSAIAGDDYLAASASVVIPEGASSVTIGILVNGDNETEPDETFFVDIVSADGADIGDAQGLGTIVNDDIATVAIHDIQGDTDTSPLQGLEVSTRGIVTGRKSNGFFLQAPDAEADADPATSEGIFVFTGSAPPATAELGNEVIVTGTVTEFLPAADPGQLNLTELVSPQVVFVSAGNNLPTPVVLTPDFPSPDGPLDQLERVEGMRVTADSFTVVAATGGNVSATNATGSSNGQLNLVVTGTPRPFREPGIQAPDPAPGGGSIPPIPRWDFNPELLFSDTDALGGPRYDLAVGATLHNYAGPLDYGFRRYSVHQDPTVAPAITQGPGPQAARMPNAEEFTIASYNLERFFDDVNDPAIGEPVLTPAAFAMRLNKASLGIRDYLHTPDILGLVEVENLATLQALADRVNADAVTAGQPDPQYVAFLEEGNDVGGIDVGFLVKTGDVRPGVARVQVLGVEQLGKDETWIEPDGDVSLLNDRPPLLLDAVVHYADGRALPLTTVLVHQRSLSRAEDDDANGERVRAKRQRQAEYLAQQLQTMQLADPARGIVALGDFNAFEFNDGLTDAMGVVTGLPSPDEATAVAGDGADLVDPDLLNLYVFEPDDQRYSFEFGGNAQSLDHILVNQTLGAMVGALALDHARINADFPEIWRGDAGTVARLADHDPAIAYFSAASADVAIDVVAAADSVAPGEAMQWQATALNNGPSQAAYPGIGFAFDAELPDLAVTAPAGWSCDAPTVGNGSTVVACAASALAVSNEVHFALQATAPASSIGDSIVLAASVDTQSYDPQADNDHASAAIAVTVAGMASDLSVNLDGPRKKLHYGRVERFPVTLANAGPDAAWQPRVVLRGDAPAANVSVATPDGWQCAAVDTVDGFEAECANDGSFATGAVQGFDFAIRIPARPDSSFHLNLAASADATTPDPDTSNNTDTYSNRIVGVP